MKVTPRKDGRLTIPYYLQGKRKFLTSRAGETEDDLLERLRLLLEAATQISPEAEFIPGTVAHFIYGDWWTWKRSEIRGTTKRKYNGMIKHQICPALGHKMLTEVTWKDIQALKDDMPRKDKRDAEISPRHRREVLLLTKDIFGRAKDLDLISKNPCDLVNLPTIGSRKKKREEPPEDFSERLMAKAMEKEPHVPLVIFLAMFLAMRRGEICGLPKMAINRKTLQISVHTQLQPYDGNVNTKGDVRVLEVTEEIIAWIDRFMTDDNSGYVVTRKGKPLNPNEVSKMIPRLCVEAGLPVLTLHDLRSLAVSNLLALDVDPFSIMEILGHTKIDTSWLYLNAKKKKKREALQALFQSTKVG